MAIFWVATVIPLVSLFLLSFTQGDMTLYANQWTQIESGGFNATATGNYDSTQAEASFGGIVAISLGLLALGGAFLLMLERRWGRAAFEN